ncbi:hypothetical protein TNCV_2284231 [Trichonephila clavipes]|nr:hypothetical protein TNCV_2284231 [Trichonephila clavipes]
MAGKRFIRLARCGACPVNCHAQEVLVLPRRLRGSDVGEDLLKGGETCGWISSVVQIYRGGWMVSITCFAFAPKDVWRVAPTADGLLGMCT